MLPKRRLRTISLIGNPLDCDCRLAWLVDVHEAGGVVWGSCAPAAEGGEGAPAGGTRGHARPLLAAASYRVEESCTKEQLPECFKHCKDGLASPC